METMKEWILNIKSLRGYDALFIGLIVSLFCTQAITAVYLMIVLGISLYKKELIPALRKQPGALWIYGFIGLQIVVSAWASNMVGLVNALGMGLVMAWLALYRDKIHPKTLILGIDLMLVLSILTGIYALFQFQAFSQAEGYSFWEFHIQNSPKRRIMATFGNANLYATMLEMWIFLAVYRFTQNKKISYRIFVVLVSLFNFGLLLLTGCRTAILPFVIVIPLFLWLAKEKSWFWVSMIVIGIGILFVCLDPTKIPRITDMSTLESRFKIWRCAWIGFCAYPLFGLGPQSYGLYYRMFDGHKAPHCHNIYIDAFASYGIVGVVLLLVYAFRFLLPEIFSMRKKDSAVFGLMVGMIGIFLIHGLLDVTMNVLATSLVFLMILNAAPLYKKIENPSESMIS